MTANSACRDEAVVEATRRYHHDAEFHAEVEQAAAVVLSDYPFLSESERTFARGHALMAAAVALNLRDQNGSDGFVTVHGREIDGEAVVTKVPRAREYGRSTDV